MPKDTSLTYLSNSVSKIVENSNKIVNAVLDKKGDSKNIQENIEEIRKAICGSKGILKTLYTINNNIENSEKKTLLSKLPGKKSNDINTRKILKDTNSITGILKNILTAVNNVSGKGGRKLKDVINKPQVKKIDRIPEDRRDRKFKSLQSISKSIDIVERLKSITLKDFILTKRKMKNLGKIMVWSRNIFRNFKNQKEAEATISFVNSSIDIIKKLSKIWTISKPAQNGAKAIEKIFFGGKKPGGGLLGLFKKLSKDKRQIERGRKTTNDILKSCGSFLLTTMILTGIAALAIPAMVGALLMKGVVHLLIGTYKVLSKSARPIRKGSMVMLAMSTSVIAFALGLGLMVKAVKGMKLKDVGLMIASIAGVGLAVAGVGLLAVPIAIGSGVLLLIGASIGILGLALKSWKSIDVKSSMGNVKEAIEGLRDAFGLELGKNTENKSFGQRLRGGLMDIAMGVLNFGKTFFVMGSLLLASAALGLLYHGLKKWTNFDGTKSAKNIRTAVGTLKDVFGLNEVEGGGGAKLKALGGGILDLGISMLQSGKAFVQLGTLVVATAMMDMIRLTLKPWQKDFDARPAANNMKIAIDALKETFGLNDRNGQSIGGKISGGLGDLIGLASSIFQMGSTFTRMGTLVFATAMMDVIRLTLIPWNNYDSSQAIGNMSIAVKGLSDCFGLKENNQGIKDSILGSVSDLFSLGTGLIKMGDTFVRMGTLLIATGAMNKIKDNLTVWEKYKPTNAITNIRTAVDSLLETFGLTGIERIENEVDNSLIGKAGKILSSVGDLLSAPFKMASSLVETATTAAEGGAAMMKISNILHSTSIVATVKGVLEPWESFNPSKSISNISSSITSIEGLFDQIGSIRGNESNLKTSNALYFETSSLSIKNGITNIATAWKNSKILQSVDVPFKKTIDSVNSLNIEKASTMIGLFKSFADIKQKPFDKFTISVNKFSESCGELIDALNNFSENHNVNVETGNKQNENVEGSITRTDNVNINNTSALAKAIAEAIKSLPINVENNMSDIRLVVDGMSGKRVVLSLE